MEEENDQPEKEFEDNIRDKSRRKIKARREKERGVWFGIGMFGLVGWSVAIPALLFLALGIWIDSRYKGPYSWTLMLLIIGIIIGCLNAWYWVKTESESSNDKHSNES
jgi:ATP synthase protein I